MLQPLASTVGAAVPAVNIWAVLLATLASVVVGAIWYARPVFGRRWAELSGIGQDALRKTPVGAYIATILGSVLTAAVLAGTTGLAQQFYGGSWFWNAVVTGLVLWIGFTAARIISHDTFSRRPSTLTIINLGNELVTILAMAVVIGAFGDPGLASSL